MHRSTKPKTSVTIKKSIMNSTMNDISNSNSPGRSPAKELVNAKSKLRRYKRQNSGLSREFLKNTEESPVDTLKVNFTELTLAEEEARCIHRTRSFSIDDSASSLRSYNSAATDSLRSLGSIME
jgi:hypothetical protein